MIRLQSFLVNFIKKSTFGGFRYFLFWNVYTFYLIDLGVPKIGFLVFLLGGIWRGVSCNNCCCCCCCCCWSIFFTICCFIFIFHFPFQVKLRRHRFTNLRTDGRMGTPSFNDTGTHCQKNHRTLVLQGMAMSTNLSGESVLQKAMTGMLTQADSVMGWWSARGSEITNRRGSLNARWIWFVKVPRRVGGGVWGCCVT